MFVPFLEARHEGAPVSLVEVVCENNRCGIKFLARVVDRKRGWGRYCGKSCKAAVQKYGRSGFKKIETLAPGEFMAIGEGPDWKDNGVKP